MKKFIVHLTREYIVQIEANNEDDAQTYSSLYVSGGLDESSESIRKQNNFEILHINPTLNDAFSVEEIKS